MTITVQDLTTLNPALVTQFDAELTTLVQEENPTFDLRAGVFHDLLIHVNAQLNAAIQTNINIIIQSNSLQAIQANPALSDVTVVGALLSNYNIVDNPGAEATGTVTFIINQLIGVVIPSTMVLTINGLTFNPNITYAARTSSLSIITSSDTLIYPIGTNLWAFDIQATATAIGSDGNVTRSTTVTPDVAPPNFVKAYVKSDFTGGVDADTTQTLIAKLEGGQAIKAWSNRSSILGLLRDQPNFANILNGSIIGFGDPEMDRDQHSIWPGHLGGRSDLYLQSQPFYQDVTVQKTATLLSKSGSVGLWQTSLILSDAPGFYSVDRVLLTAVDQSTPGFQVSSDVRSFDLSSPPSNTLNPPDIVTVVEAAFSRYETSTIQWYDTITNAAPLSIGATAPYNVILRVMPLIDQVQDFLNARTNRPPMCDVLVRGAIPCFTTMAFTVNYNSNLAAPDVPTIQTAVANAVNNIGFTGELPISLINQTLHNLAINLLSVTGYTLIGTILQPDLTLVIITDPQLLVIPNNPTDTITSRTTLFFLNPTDVSVTLVPVDIQPV